jgi:hypothetical protein
MKRAALLNAALLIATGPALAYFGWHRHGANILFVLGVIITFLGAIKLIAMTCFRIKKS